MPRPRYGLVDVGMTRSVGLTSVVLGEGAGTSLTTGQLYAVTAMPRAYRNRGLSARIPGMRRVNYPLEVKASAATGTAKACGGMIDKWVYLYGTFVATVELQGSMDGGTTWFTLGTFASPTKFEVPECLSHIRTNTTAYTSGTPACVLAGRETGA